MTYNSLAVGAGPGLQVVALAHTFYQQQLPARQLAGRGANEAFSQAAHNTIVDSILVLHLIAVGPREST
jgi:hypothetical protein